MKALIIDTSTGKTTVEDVTVFAIQTTLKVFGQPLNAASTVSITMFL